MVTLTMSRASGCCTARQTPFSECPLRCMYVELGLVHKALGSYMFSVTAGRVTSLVRLRGCAGLLLATL